MKKVGIRMPNHDSWCYFKNVIHSGSCGLTDCAFSKCSLLKSIFCFNVPIGLASRNASDSQSNPFHLTTFLQWPFLISLLVLGQAISDGTVFFLSIFAIIAMVL